MYFRCQRCGNVNKRKVFEINTVVDMKDKMNETSTEKTAEKKPILTERKEIVITSRDTDWCD